MEQSYQSKYFLEIQSSPRRASADAGNIDDFYSFTSSDESFNSNSSNSSKSFHKKNDISKRFDLLLDHNSSRSFTEMDLNEASGRKQRHNKSSMSIIKFLKSLTSRSKAESLPMGSRSILRRPTEYEFVTGMSGLQIRVVKASSSTASCPRCVARN